MRRVSSILVCVIVSVSIAAQENKVFKYATDARGIYLPTSHAYSQSSSIPRSDYSMIHKMVDSVVNIFKRIYPEPVGVNIGPYGGILGYQNSGGSEIMNRPYSVKITLPFYDLYQTASGKAEPSGEYASSITIWINNISLLLGVNYVQDSNGSIFIAPYEGIPVSGFPKYNNMILILPAGKTLPWRPATKQEYLEKYIQSKRAGLKSSSLPAEREDISKAEQFLAMFSPAEKKQLAYLPRKDNTICEFGTFRWVGFADVSDKNAAPLVIIDENFYDNGLSRNSFQVMEIERNSVDYRKSDAYKMHHKRMSEIVQLPGLVKDLQQLLGRDGTSFINTKQPQKNIGKTDVVIKNKAALKDIDRGVDSLFRNYKIVLPGAPSINIPRPANGGSSVTLPARNERKLALAARRLETREELVNYLDELDKKLSAALPGPVMNAYNNSVTTDRASFGYRFFGKPRESLLLAIKAAKQNPDDNCALNNLGATLTICGAGFLGIPVEIVCIKKDPENSTITNNLGQAYLSLGDQQEAEYYLKRCIGTAPYHPHANSSLGYIYKSRGNKDAAIKHFENSLRGSFTLSAYNGLNSLKKEAALKLMDYVRHRYRQPDYINLDKYPVPKQCDSYEETELRKAEYDAYEKMLGNEIAKYNKLLEQEKPLAAKSANDFLNRLAKERQITKPFQPFAYYMIGSILNEYNDKVNQLQKELIELGKQRMKLELEFKLALKEVDDQFEKRSDAVGEGNGDPTLDEEICNAKNRVVNHYLPLFADLNREEFTKIIHAHKDYFNDYLFWIRFATLTKEQYQVAYYETVLVALKTLKLVRITTLPGYCNDLSDIHVKKDTAEMKKPDCPLPIGVEIPFVVGKISLDCDKWGIEAGELIVVNFEHQFGGETTIAIGVGETLDLTPKLFGEKSFDLNPGIDVNAKAQVFLTLDGNKIMDWGLTWEGEVDLKVLAEFGEIKQNFKLGVNSGFVANGILTDAIDKYYEIPKEIQVNKDLKIYKPH